MWWRSGAAELAELGVAEFGAAELGAAGLGAGIAAAAAGAGVVVVQGCLSVRAAAVVVLDCLLEVAMQMLKWRGLDYGVRSRSRTGRKYYSTWI